YEFTGDVRYRTAATSAIAPLRDGMTADPAAAGAALRVAAALTRPATQLVVVSGAEGVSGPLVEAARALDTTVTALVSQRQARALGDAVFALFEGRDVVDGAPTAYLCRDFVCSLPTSDAAELRTLAEKGERP